MRLERAMNAAPAQLGAVGHQPRMADGEDIVGVPHLVRGVALDYPLQFVGHLHRAASPVREAVHGVRAPVALVGAAAGGDEVDAAGAMVSLPGIEVELVIDGFAIRPRQAVQVGNLGALGGAHDGAGLVAKRDAIHLVQAVGAAPRERRDQLRERELAFTDDDDAGAGVEVFRGVVGALGAAEDHRPAMAPRRAHDFEHRAARHEIGVDAHDATRRGREARREFGTLAKRAVENLHRKSGALQVCREIQQAERRIRLHDLPFLLIVGQEVAVGEQQVGHGRISETRPPIAGPRAAGRATRRRPAPGGSLLRSRTARPSGAPARVNRDG